MSSIRPWVRPESRASATAKRSAKIRENVRGLDTYVVQPTSSPVNDNLMELLIIVRRAPSRLGGRHHRGDSVLRLRPSGPQGRAPHAHHLEARRRPAGGRRRDARRLRGPARRTDPGLFQHPVRSPVRAAGVSGRLPEAEVRPEHGVRLAGRRRRRARARVLEAPRRQSSRSSTSAASGAERERGHAPHRRRERS